MLVLFTLYGRALRLPWPHSSRDSSPWPSAPLWSQCCARSIIYNASASPPSSLPDFIYPIPPTLWLLLTHRERFSYLPVIFRSPLSTPWPRCKSSKPSKSAGDDYRTTPSLLMNGIGTLVAAFLGSPFPTTLYVGHAAHKANGARSGYSALNGFITLILCTTGLSSPRSARHPA